MLCQNGDVICPLSQWWDLNRKHIESVVKVFTKAARRHFLLQVPIGRSDDPHIREPRPVLAHALVTLLLQDAEQFALQFQRNFSDFIEENRPSFSRLETSGAVLDPPVKAPRAWPKNSLSYNSFGMEAQLTRTSALSLRRLRRWISRATNSLPVPVSPRTSTEASVGATRSIWLTMCRNGALWPTRSPNALASTTSSSR